MSVQIWLASSLLYSWQFPKFCSQFFWQICEFLNIHSMFFFWNGFCWLFVATENSNINCINHMYSDDLKSYISRFDVIYNHTLYRQSWLKQSPREKKHKKAKWLSEEVLQIAEKRREAKGKGEKERYTHLNAEFQRIARRAKKKSLPKWLMQRKRKTIQWERLEIS